MASGASIRAKVSRVLGKVKSTSRLIQLREIVRTPANSRLGLGGTTVVTTTPLDPQPSIEYLSTSEIASSGGLYQPGDYRLMVSGDMSEEILKTGQLLYGDEPIQIMQVLPTVYDGTVVLWTVTGRTVSEKVD